MLSSSRFLIADLKGLSVVLPSVLDFKFAFAATVFICKLALWKLVNTIFKELLFRVQ